MNSKLLKLEVGYDGIGKVILGSKNISDYMDRLELDWKAGEAPIIKISLNKKLSRWERFKLWLFPNNVSGECF